MRVEQHHLGRAEARTTTLRRSLIGAALLLAAFGSPALGADYSIPMPDVLRGPVQPIVGAPNYPRWDGFYFGGQGGRSSGNVNFGNASASQISYILANSDLEPTVATWTTLPEVKSSSASYGGFIGYSLQWEDVVTSLELNYNHLAFSASASDSTQFLKFPMQTQADGTSTQYQARVASSAAIAIHDIVTARARFGWTFDRLLPYAFVGVAIGRADVFNFTDVNVQLAITPAPVVDAFGVSHPQPQGPFNDVPLVRNPQTLSKSLIAYGFTGGLGLDVGVTQNVFLRAEWEFVEFPNISDFRVQMNTVRVGAGLKF